MGFVSDILKHTIIGLLAKLPDTDSFANSIINLLNVQELRSSMSADCRQTAVYKYIIDYEDDVYIKLFTDLIKNNKTLH